MKKYNVYAMVRGRKFLGTFEASNEEEAIEKAIEENGFISLCHQCSSECEDAELENIEAEEEV